MEYPVGNGVVKPVSCRLDFTMSFMTSKKPFQGLILKMLLCLAGCMLIYLICFCPLSTSLEICIGFTRLGWKWLPVCSVGRPVDTDPVVSLLIRLRPLLHISSSQRNDFIEWMVFMSRTLGRDWDRCLTQWKLPFKSSVFSLWVVWGFFL